MATAAAAAAAQISPKLVATPPPFSVAELPHSPWRVPVATGNLARLAFGQSSNGMAWEVGLWILSSFAVFGAFLGWAALRFPAECVGDSKRLRRLDGTVATLPDIPGWMTSATAEEDRSPPRS